ncbi:MAG: porin family protein [Bacteroidales bacterium]|nr:porin family protein [Bacteroidales bacterium]
MRSKRLMVLVALFLMVATSLTAQQNLLKRRNTFDGVIKVGVKGGINISTMYYSDYYLHQLDQVAVVGPMAGVFVEVPLIKMVSVSPEVMFIGRGTSTEYVDRDGYTTQYSLKSNNISLRVPVMLKFSINRVGRLFIFAGPEVGCNIGGKISLTHKALSGSLVDNVEVDMGKSNMALFHSGLLAGGGVRFNIMVGRKMMIISRLELAYNYGYTDTFSSMEKEEISRAVNVNAYNINGKRKYRGIELTLSCSLPMTEMPTMCRDW